MLRASVCICAGIRTCRKIPGRKQQRKLLSGGQVGRGKVQQKGKKIKNSNNFSLLCVPMWNFCDCILCAGVEKFVDIFLGAGARAVAASLCFSFPFYSFIRCMS